jgi:hypothetical protein
MIGTNTITSASSYREATYESSLPSDNSKNSLGMLVQFPQPGNNIKHEVSAKGIERLRPVELDCADFVGVREGEDDVLVVVWRHVCVALSMIQGTVIERARCSEDDSTLLYRGMQRIHEELG